MSTEELFDLISAHHETQIQKLDAHHEEQKTQIEDLKKSIVEIDTALRGSYEKKGLISKVHNLEQSEESRKRLTFAAVTSAIGATIAAIWSFLTKH